MRLDLIGIVVLAGVSLGPAKGVRAQDPCTCDFDAKSYSAVGTKAACNAFVYDGKSCEVAFSSIGANAAIASRLPNPSTEEETYQLAIDHVTLLKKKDYAALSGEKFLRAALPMLMRSTYARSAVADRLPISEIDLQAMEFLSKYTPVIANVFAGKQSPINGEWGNGYRYIINRGSLVFVTPSKARLTVVVFRPE